MKTAWQNFFSFCLLSCIRSFPDPRPQGCDLLLFFPSTETETLVYSSKPYLLHRFSAIFGCSLFSRVFKGNKNYFPWKTKSYFFFSHPSVRKSKTPAFQLYPLNLYFHQLKQVFSSTFFDSHSCQLQPYTIMIGHCYYLLAQTPEVKAHLAATPKAFHHEPFLMNFQEKILSYSANFLSFCNKQNLFGNNSSPSYSSKMLLWFLLQDRPFYQFEEIFKLIILFRLMENPESHSPALSPKMMHSYDNHTNIPWNITQYDVPALHFDQKHIVQQRMYASQKKGVKVNDFYVTRKGFYMDYDLKQAKGVPSSVVHIDQNPWDSTKTVLEGDALKSARQSKKYTIYERMEMQQQKRPVPCVSTYNLQKSIDEQREIAEKMGAVQLKHGEKRFFHEDTSFLSEIVPGPGFYSPHDEVEHLKKSIGDWKFWTKRHEKINKTMAKRESKLPSPSSYTPIYRSHNSFQAIMKKQKKEKQIKNGFGSDSRFPYVRPNKKKIKEIRPAPCRYETKIEWKGKSVNPKKKEWAKMIWKGSPPKVYS